MPTPPGFIPLEQQLDNRAGLSTQPAPGRWEQYIGEPTGQLAQAALSPMQTVGQEVMGGTFNPSRVLQSFRPTGEEPGRAAKMLNPWQTPTQAGIMAGTALTGGAASAAGLPGSMQAASRVMGATGGGLMGGIAEGGAAGGLSGAATGIVTGGIGEAIGKTADFVRKMGVDRVRTKIQEQDAAKMGEAIERIPKLKGVFGGVRDARGLEDLAKGYVNRQGKVVNTGLARIQDYMDQQDLIIRQAIDQQKSRGVTYQFPDAMKPGSFTTWENSKKSLSELGLKAFGGVKGQPLEPTISGVDSRQLYAETIRVLQAQLTLIDKHGGTKALQAFNDGQGVYEAGRYLLKNVLRPAFKGKAADRVAFNSDVIQRKLSDNRVDAAKKLGVEGFETIAPAARLTPEQMGRADVYAPHGLMSQIAGVAPLPGAAYARIHVGQPNLVGNPLTLADASRTGISLGTNKMLAPIAQMLSERMGGGIPGLGR